MYCIPSSEEAIQECREEYDKDFVFPFYINKEEDGGTFHIVILNFYVLLNIIEKEETQP